MIHLGELLSAHLDGELSLGEARLVAGHLEVCGLCRAEYDDLARARAAVRGLPSLELPSGLVPPESEAGRRFRGPARWLGAAAAAATIVIGSFALLSPPEPQVVTSADLGAVYVARSSVAVDLAPAPRYIDPQSMLVARGGE